MREKDENDTVAFEDSYSSEERELVYCLLGKEMMPKRREACRKFISKRGYTLTLRHLWA